MRRPWVVHWDDEARPTRIAIRGFTPSRPSATVEQLSGPLDGVNTADEPDRFVPRRTEWEHGMGARGATYTFPPRSITLLRLD